MGYYDDVQKLLEQSVLNIQTTTVEKPFVTTFVILNRKQYMRFARSIKGRTAA